VQVFGQKNLKKFHFNAALQAVLQIMRTFAPTLKQDHYETSFNPIPLTAC
jgi:hypothetical protein